VQVLRRIELTGMVDGQRQELCALDQPCAEHLPPGAGLVGLQGFSY
jgi:hypothetical protein